MKNIYLSLLFVVTLSSVNLLAQPAEVIARCDSESTFLGKMTWLRKKTNFDRLNLDAPALKISDETQILDSDTTPAVCELNRDSLNKRIKGLTLKEIKESRFECTHDLDGTFRVYRKEIDVTPKVILTVYGLSDDKRKSTCIAVAAKLNDLASILLNRY